MNYREGLLELAEKYGIDKEYKQLIVMEEDIVNEISKLKDTLEDPIFNDFPRLKEIINNNLIKLNLSYLAIIDKIYSIEKDIINKEFENIQQQFED